MYAPIALFAWLPANAERPGRLVPIAIQCNQDTDDIFTPQPDVDPTAPEAEQAAATSQLVAWKLARTCVQVADGTWHEMIAHLGYTHMLLEVAIVAARRTLYENHPVRVLLEPHFEFTLPLNDTAVHNLIAPGGQVDQMLGGSLDESLSVLKSGLHQFEPRVASPRREMLLRGVLDWRGLPEFPYRDDVLPVWDAIHEFVEGYLRLYYGHDGDVAGDAEVQAWIDEMGAQNGGRLDGLGEVDTFDELVELVSFIIFTASAQHAAVNFPQFPLMGYAPNLPGAGYTPPPNRDRADGTKHPQRNPDGGRYTDADWFRMLPPLRAAMMQFNVLYELAAVRVNRLGQYPRFHFLDRRVAPLLARFQRQLKDIEKATVDRDRNRLITYPYLRPSSIPASIHI
jgi:arachidonate 15-lipoxygenase